MKTVQRLCAFVAAALVLVSGSVLAAPKIKLSESNYSFGKTLQHSVLTKRFWIKSASDKPVKITEALQDCSCTDLYIKDSTIKPGDSVPLDITLHSRNFIGFVNKRSHYLVEGSPDTTYLMLYAEVLVKPEEEKPILIAPNRVDVSQFGVKPRRKGTFTLTNNTSLDYDIIVVDSIAKSFDLTLPKTIKAGQKVEGTVIVRKDKVETSFEESFAFELSDDGRSRFSVTVARLYQPADSTGTGQR
jgi:hypothetical protein